MDFLIQGPATWIWAFGGLVAAVGLVAATWAFFADRSRGCRRCPKCWYEMTGVAGLRCPECGREAKHERALLRTRRKWFRGGLACVVMLAGAAIITWPTVRERGAPSLLPTFVLVRLAPKVGTESTWDPVAMQWTMSPIAQELKRRVDADQLSPADWLAAFKAAGILKCRTTWPKDRPLVVGLSMPMAWSGASEVTFTPRAAGLYAASAGVLYWGGCGNGEAMREQAERAQTLGTLDAETREIEFDVTLTRNPAGGFGTPGPAIRIGVWKHPIRLVDRTEGVIPLESDLSLVRGTLDVRIRESEQNGMRWVELSYDPAPGEVPSTVGLGFSVELLQDGRVVEAKKLVVEHQTAWQVGAGASWYTGTSYLHTSIPRSFEEITRWSVRVSPAPDTLLTAWEFQSAAPLTKRCSLAEALGEVRIEDTIFGRP